MGQTGGQKTGKRLTFYSGDVIIFHSPQAHTSVLSAGAISHFLVMLVLLHRYWQRIFLTSTSPLISSNSHMSSSLDFLGMYFFEYTLLRKVNNDILLRLPKSSAINNNNGGRRQRRRQMQLFSAARRASSTPGPRATNVTACVAFWTSTATCGDRAPRYGSNRCVFLRV